jgi:hypothetical protein
MWDRVVDALRDAIIAGRLKPATVLHLRRAHLVRFYDNVAPLLAADRPANV